VDDESVMKKGYSGEDQLTIPTFRKYVAWAKRTIHPTLTKSAKDRITNYYIESRSKFHEDDNSVPITARALEGLVRLAEASARTRLSQEATDEDAKHAIALFKLWRFEIMGDDFDEATMATGRPAKKRSAEQHTLNVINQLTEGKQDFDVPTGDILNEMARLNFDEHEVEDALKQLSLRSQIYTPGAGRWRFVN
jgi:replicative DNA helicase Mcm